MSDNKSFKVGQHIQFNYPGLGSTTGKIESVSDFGYNVEYTHNGVRSNAHVPFKFVKGLAPSGGYRKRRRTGKKRARRSHTRRRR